MKKKILLKLGTIVLSLLVFVEPLGGAVYAVKNGKQVKQRAIEVGVYIVENNATQIDAAAFFNVSETTVRNYVYRLQTINQMFYEHVIEIIKRRRNRMRIRDCVSLSNEIGRYIVENNATQINAAAFFNISETTVRNYIYRLQTINPMLYQQVIEIIEQHRYN